MVEFDPEIDRHADLRDAILDHLDEQGRVSTPDLVDEMQERVGTKYDWSDGYLRSLLTYARQHMEANGDIITEQERRGGHPTYYWMRRGTGDTVSS